MGKRQEISPKRIHKGHTSTWKGVQHHYLSEKCKIRSWGTITHLSDYPLKKIVTTPSAREDEEKLVYPYSVSRNVKCDSLPENKYGGFLKNDICTYHLTQQSHLGLFIPQNCKCNVHTQNCTRMFPAALFTMGPNWKWHRCSSTDGWFKWGPCTTWSTTQQ